MVILERVDARHYTPHVALHPHVARYWDRALFHFAHYTDYCEPVRATEQGGVDISVAWLYRERTHRASQMDDCLSTAPSVL